MNVRRRVSGSSTTRRENAPTVGSPHERSEMRERRLRLAPAPDVAPLILGLLSEIRSGRHSPRRRGIQYAAASRLRLRPLEYWVVRSSRTTTVEIRSAPLPLFWHCGRPQNSSRTGPERPPGNEPSMVLAEIERPKGLAMLTSSEKCGVRGGAAKAASMSAPAIPAASAPTLLLGGLLLLIGP